MRSLFRNGRWEFQKPIVPEGNIKNPLSVHSCPIDELRGPGRSVSITGRQRTYRILSPYCLFADRNGFPPASRARCNRIQMAFIGGLLKQKPEYLHRNWACILLRIQIRAERYGFSVLQFNSWFPLWGQYDILNALCVIYSIQSTLPSESFFNSSAMQTNSILNRYKMKRQRTLNSWFLICYFCHYYSIFMSVLFFELLFYWVLK